MAKIDATKSKKLPNCADKRVKVREDGTPLYDVADMVKRIDKYIADNTRTVKGKGGNVVDYRFPIAKECFLQNGWARATVYDTAQNPGGEKLQEALERLTDAKEIRLERGAAWGYIDKTLAIFSLKQLGWRDGDAPDKSGVTVIMGEATKYAK